MMHDIDQFDQIKEIGPITKHERRVDVPGLDEERRQVIYEAFGKRWWVGRVSTLGWTVTEYDANGSAARRASTDGYLDSETAAHELAKEWVQEIGEEIED
jgi:hypothetical protein